MLCPSEVRSIISFAQSTNEIRDEMKLSRFQPNEFYKVNLTVIGPFTDEAKKNAGTYEPGIGYSLV